MAYAHDVSTTELDAVAERLKPIPPKDIGSAEWKQQREDVEILNFASHKAAAQKSNDYAMASLLSHGTLTVLIHEVLAMESWRHRVLPEVLSELSDSPTGLHMYASYESIVVNFLECMMYHEECVTGFGDDILELIDYLWRNVAALFATGSSIHDIVETADPTKAQARADLSTVLSEMSVSRAMGSISCLWYVIDRLPDLPLAVTNSVLHKNDLLTGFAQVLELQPWLRRSASRYQKFRAGSFVDVSSEDSMLVVPPEAHSWFVMHHLLCNRLAREKYQYTAHKKGVILRVKKFLHETLVDQIPALVDVQRALEELSFLEPPSGTEEKFKSMLIIEQVPRIRRALDGENWDAIVQRMKGLLTSPEAKMDDARRYAKLFSELYTGPE